MLGTSPAKLAGRDHARHSNIMNCRERLRLTLAVAALLAWVRISLGATHEIYPTHHSRVFSAYKEPVLRIKSGDTVITRTWDSGGQDHLGVRHIQHPYVHPES